MLGIPVRYFLRHPAHVAAELAASPRQSLANFYDSVVDAAERRGPQCHYTADPHWEPQLHAALGIPFPCAAAAEFWELWPRVMQELEDKGIKPGPESLEQWNDGDAGLVRAIWCLIRHLKPNKIVETGVAHGVTSRFVLEALERNGSDGRLWSIDLPSLDHNLRLRVGAAVGPRFADRWTLLRGTSRQHLPKLLASLGEIDLFIHDSLHSKRNVVFELQTAAPAVAPRGVIVIDDIDANWGFDVFTKANPMLPSFIAEAEPIRPDLRRFNDKGLFGVILKQSAAAAKLPPARAADQDRDHYIAKAS
jgi:hypothetical protein